MEAAAAEDGIGPEAFASARRAERLRRTMERAARREEAGRRLWAARQSFMAAAEQAYGQDSGAAARDADRLEALAGRLADFVRSLEPAIERLEIAADRASTRAGIPVRGEIRFDAPALCDLLAETMAEALLGAESRGVLMAAVRNASA